MTNENGKILSIVENIHKDVREVRDDVKNIAKEVFEHGSDIRSNKRNIAWLYKLLGGTITGIVVGVVIWLLR